MNGEVPVRGSVGAWSCLPHPHPHPVGHGRGQKAGKAGQEIADRRPGLPLLARARALVLAAPANSFSFPDGNGEKRHCLVRTLNPLKFRSSFSERPAKEGAAFLPVCGVSLKSDRRLVRKGTSGSVRFVLRTVAATSAGHRGPDGSARGQTRALYLLA